MLKQKTSTKNKKGFTLVEILTVVFLGTLIILAAYSVYIISYKAYKRNSASSEVTQNGRIALERMSREIRQTVDIITDLPADPSEGTPPAEIKFQDGHNFWPVATATPATPTPTPSSTAVQGQIQYLTYYLSGTDLHRKVSHYYFAAYPDDWVLWSTQDNEGNSPLEQVDLDQIKAQQITSLQFWGDKTITVRLTASDGTISYPFETKCLGRNIQ